MKLKTFLIFTVFSLGLTLQMQAQSCRDLYREAKSLEKQGKLEKAKTKYQQVVSCGDKLYYDDSKERVEWIDRILRKPDPVKPFSISENEVIIPYQGGQDVITVDGSGNWQAEIIGGEKEWCTIKKGKGKIYILSKANESNIERTCIVSVSMSGKSKQIQVKNEKAPEILIPSVENITFPYNGESNTVEIHANTDWEVKNVPEWVKSSKEEDKITFTALANENNAERKAEIKIQGTSKTVIINIYQGAGLDHLAFSKNDLHFGPDGGDEYINIYTDADEWRLGDFPHWCQVTKVADNLLRVHCTPNEPINLNREASVNVTTGKQMLGINVTQEAKPFVAMIPTSGIGGRAVSFGFHAGYLFPMISTSSGGSFTGSLVNYANGTSLEEASYTTSSSFAVGGYADIRVYKNLYLTVGLDFTHYKYKNDYQANGIRNVMVGSNTYYGKGKIQDNYQEDYTFNTLEIPIIASYRFPVTKISHIQLNIGPVISWGLSAKMKFSGTSDGEKLDAYEMDRFGMTDHLLDEIELYPHHIQASGSMNLYDNKVSYTETYVEHNYATVEKSQEFEAAPFKRFNLGARLGVAYEYSGISIGVDYNFVCTNMANKRYWEGERWTVFDYSSSTLMSGYKQYNHYLQIKIGYTFRY